MKILSPKRLDGLIQGQQTSVACVNLWGKLDPHRRIMVDHQENRNIVVKYRSIVTPYLVWSLQNFCEMVNVVFQKSKFWPEFVVAQRIKVNLFVRPVKQIDVS